MRWCTARRRDPATRLRWEPRCCSQRLRSADREVQPCPRRGSRPTMPTCLPRQRGRASSPSRHLPAVRVRGGAWSGVPGPASRSQAIVRTACRPCLPFEQCSKSNDVQIVKQRGSRQALREFFPVAGTDPGEGCYPCSRVIRSCVARVGPSPELSRRRAVRRTPDSPRESRRSRLPSQVLFG